jgi:hypothetical protein
MYYISLALARAQTHRYWHDLESFFWVVIHVILRQIDGIRASRRTIDSVETRVEVLEDVFPSFRGEIGLNKLSQGKKAFLGTFVGIKKCPRLARAIEDTSNDLKRLHNIFDALDNITESINFQLSTTQEEPGQIQVTFGHYQAEGSDDLAKALELLSDEVKLLEEPEGPLEDLNQDIQHCEGLIQSLTFPSFEVFIERWRNALLDPPVPCVPYIPPRETSINDVLIGKIQATSQKRPINQSAGSPCKGRDNKRKRSQSDLSGSGRK